MADNSETAALQEKPEVSRRYLKKVGVLYYEHEFRGNECKEDEVECSGSKFYFPQRDP